MEILSVTYGGWDAKSVLLEALSLSQSKRSSPTNGGGAKCPVVSSLKKVASGQQFGGAPSSTASGAAAREEALARCSADRIHIKRQTYHCLLDHDPFPFIEKEFAITLLDRRTTVPQCRVYVAREQLDDLDIDLSDNGNSAPRLGARTEQPRIDSVIAATYGGADVTAEVTAMFERLGRISVTRPAELFGDPMPGVVKALVVVYRQAASRTKALSVHGVAYWYDGEHAELPGKTGCVPPV